ncbi:MAG: arylsulfotransferase family protein [Alphaproteobacteria bacterium]
MGEGEEEKQGKNQNASLFIKGFLLGVVLFYYAILLLKFEGGPIFKAIIEDPVKMVTLLQYKSGLLNDPYIMHYFNSVNHDYKGLARKKEGGSWGEYSFAVSSKGSHAFLLDLDGNEVHSWVAPFSQKWGEVRHLDSYVPLQHIVIDRAFLAPEMNGDLYVQYLGFGDPADYHYGMAKLDKDSNVLWRFEDRAHHDVEFVDDFMLTFVSETTTVPNPHLPNVSGEHFNEYLVWIDPETGKERKRLNIFDAFVDSKYQDLLHMFVSDIKHSLMRPGDVLHPNTITLIPDHVVGKAPMLKEDSVMISFRNLDLLIIIDLNSEKVTWASYGPWKGQHSPRFLDNGHMILFDNMGGIGTDPRGLSRVLEIDLNTMAIAWEYQGQEGARFFSIYNSMVDPLPNGNVFVTATHQGRLLEVNRDKEIVWDYFLPERIQDGELQRIPLVYSGKRYSAEQVKFLNLGEQPTGAINE